MEKIFKDPVQFSKAINLKDLMTSETEFHIDMDFKKKVITPLLNADEDVFPDMGDEDDSDDEDIIKIMEESTEKMMLSSPEYHSFEKLASKMVDCVPSGDVKILIIEEGDGPLVPVDAEVLIHYAAYWERAKIPFDCTLTMNSGAPERIRLGAGRFLPGLEIGLTTVRGPAARFHLLLQPAAAWGPHGAPPRVRPEPALFVIVLYDVKDNQAAARFNDLPAQEQSKYEVTIKTVKSLRLDAKELFAKKKYGRAIKNYQQAMCVLGLSHPENEEHVSEIKNLKIKMYINLAVCYYRINKPKHIINMCEALDRIIDIEKHCKALFYYGRAYELLGKSDMALVYYKKALKLEPKNNEIGKMLAKLDEKNKKSAVDEKEMWQKAFDSEPLEKKAIHDVDEDFQNGVMEMCKDLAERNEYAKFDLPTGLSKNEVDCIKSLISSFKGLIVEEDGEGKKKKVTIIKRLSA